MDQIPLHQAETFTAKTNVLDVLVSSDAPLQRMLVIKERTVCGIEQMILQQESFAPDVGWFTQSRVAMNREQLSALKVLLTGRASEMTTVRRPTLNRLPATEVAHDEELILSFPRAS